MTASWVAVTVPGGVASASPVTVTCSKFTGDKATQKLTGCSGSGKSQTGASGTSVAASNDESATIRWATGKTTAEKYSYKGVKPNECPAVSGYKKFLEVTESGSVTGGSATELKGGRVSGKVCIYTKDSSYLLKNLGPMVI